MDGPVFFPIPDLHTRKVSGRQNGKKNTRKTGLRVFLRASAGISG
jgi:hypothetical protein